MNFNYKPSFDDVSCDWCGQVTHKYDYIEYYACVGCKSLIVVCVEEYRDIKLSKLGI